MRRASRHARKLREARVIKIYEGSARKMKKILHSQNKLPLALSAAISPFHLEADRSSRGLSLSVGGVRAVSEFSESTVALKLGFCVITVRGRNFCLAIYENNTAEITGIVETVEFSYAKA